MRGKPGVRVNAGELIERLREFPPDTLVLVDAYEGECGFDGLRLHDEQVRFVDSEGYWDGDWRERSRYGTDADDGPWERAIILSRTKE